MEYYSVSGDDSSSNPDSFLKEIFAILLFSFFIILAINSMIKQSEQTIKVNTSGQGGQTVIESSLLADISMKQNKICITQDKTEYILPDDLKKLLSHGNFQTRKDENGKEHQVLIMQNPGKTLSAGEMLSIVNLLNNAKVGVDFRTAPTREK